MPYPNRSPNSNLFGSKAQIALENGDWQWCHETWEGLQGPCDSPDCTDGGCDCQNSEIVVVSNGYAEVFKDGDVVQHGTVLFNVSEAPPRPTKTTRRRAWSLITR